MLVRTWNVFHGNEAAGAAWVPPGDGAAGDGGRPGRGLPAGAARLGAPPTRGLERHARVRRRRRAASPRPRPARRRGHRARPRTVPLGAHGPGERDPDRPVLRPLRPARSCSTRATSAARRPASSAWRAARGSRGRRSAASATLLGSVHGRTADRREPPCDQLERRRVARRRAASGGRLPRFGRRPEDMLVLAGDFNVVRETSAGAEERGEPGLGFRRAGPGHRPPPRARRAATRRSGLAQEAASRRRRLVSDHAPVESEDERMTLEEARAAVPGVRAATRT